MTHNLIIKFLNDKCTDEELKEVVHWIKYEALNDDSRRFGQLEWENSMLNDDLMEKENYNLILDKIHHKINIRHEDSKEKDYLQSAFVWLTRVAAVLLFPVLIFLFYTMSEKSDSTSELSDLAVESFEIVTPVGSRTVVHLSDGSEVYLNHGSKLKYPQKFTGDIREVILSGEGYFDVAHNPDKPFVVKTGRLNVKALGTEFNVSAYTDDKYVEATLVKGKVLVEKIGENLNSKSLGAMLPGQHISYNLLSEKVTCTKGDIEKYISWKDGKLIFKNESIINIANRLSRWYNVEFEFKDKEARDFTYTATFVDETLFQILDLLKIATPITYKTLPRRKLPDGTFTKQKIIISSRD